VRLAGVYSNPIIVSGYGYNLLIYPVSDADIRIRISAEGVIRNQIRRISAYPYPTTAQKPYPDNPCWLAVMPGDRPLAGTTVGKTEQRGYAMNVGLG